MTRRRRQCLAFAPALAMAVALLSALACKIPNENHCLHKDSDANAWCEQRDADLPFCSPCEATNHGCVASEPTAALCPDYSQGTTGGSEGDTDTTMGETGTDTGSESGT